ncbi:MAG: YdcF family protein [Flavobacteriales bacterium]
MKSVKSLFKYLSLSSGIFFLLMVALAFTDLPYLAYHQLGTSTESLKENPETIVVFGGSGMPSPNGLMRTYYAAEAANKYEDASVIIALPFGEDSLDTYQLDLMANELKIRGVDSARISFEPHGHNTHSQSVLIAEMLGGNIDSPTLVITSPEHMYRAVRSLHKAGLNNVGGLPSFEKPISEKRLNGKKNKGENVVLAWRYNVWSYLKYEILVLREYCAIAYYKLKGWI